MITAKPKKNGQNENEIENGKSCTVHTKFIQFLGFLWTHSLSSLYKQKIKYILCSLTCIWKRPCFLRKICQYTRISIARGTLSLSHFFFKARGKPEEKTVCNRGIFATSPSRLCNQHGRLRMPKRRSALTYIEKTLLKIIHSKKWT